MYTALIHTTQASVNLLQTWSSMYSIPYQGLKGCIWCSVITAELQKSAALHLGEPGTKWGNTDKEKDKKEERQKEKMSILNRISAVKVLLAILQDWQLAKAVLTACSFQAQYLQLFHKAKYLQPGEGKNTVFPYLCHVPAWQSKAKHNTCSRKPQGIRIAQALHLGLTNCRNYVFLLFLQPSSLRD